MFDNVLGQGATGQLAEDIKAGILSRAMLFSGPPASGKGTAALELARVTSCEKTANWNCACPACARHKLLIHQDLLCMGRRDFSAEIAASAAAFLREPRTCRILFMRSVRKLLARFNPVLWEDDLKASKISPLANSLEEALDEVSSFAANSDGKAGEPPVKLIESINKDALKLEAEGLSETIPIAQLRRAAFWCRLAPSGREKLLVIENADRMQEEGRNSLLKLLEEPPARLRIVLTSARPGSLPTTILSRLRPYRFIARGADVEAEVIKRVFREKEQVKSEELKMKREQLKTQLDGDLPTDHSSLFTLHLSLSSYLDSFLPVTAGTLRSLAAFFAASAAYKAAQLARRGSRPLPDEVALLGKHGAPMAEAAGLGRPLGAPGPVVAAILEKADKFEVRSLFPRFLSCLLEQVSESLQPLPKEAPAPLPGDAALLSGGIEAGFLPQITFYEMWAKNCNWAESAVGTYNLRPGPVLEKIYTDLSRGMAGL